ncbi:MAG: hypothetical protein A2Y33_13810 [Spirochaetes bacterium GWF1_51_8]|nr:MAG: hypothetical protein A2Y33_13810 [Spirochaetes bacterium GWF1_51_8]
MNEITVELLSLYESIRADIVRRVDELSRPRNDAGMFEELAFCLCTPQSSARRCFDAVERLKREGLLNGGSAGEIAECIRGDVRFHHTKGKRIVAARGFFFTGGADRLRAILAGGDILAAREWLAGNIKGLGFKETSHFLRNNGYGDRLAILDRHVQRFLMEAGILERMPSSIDRKLYLSIEEKMTKFADSIRISLGHLDFVLWYRLKSEIFK